MSGVYAIVCDGCGEVAATSRAGFSLARRFLRERGGQTGLRGGRDLCGECIRNGVKPR